MLVAIRDEDDLESAVDAAMDAAAAPAKGRSRRGKAEPAAPTRIGLELRAHLAQRAG